MCEEEEEKGFTRYIRGNGRLVASDSESARTYYHYACDSLGSVDYVIVGNEFGCDGNYGGIDQRVLCRYAYDAFGNTADAFENVGNRYGFTGEMRDDVTGMYYLRARYYSSGIGRFTQADTYHGDGFNLYVYAGNNPVRYVDPSGHCCKDNSVVESGTSSGIRFPENPNELFQENYAGLTKEVKPDGKIKYTVQAGEFEYIVEYHPNHGGENHFDGNRYHVLKKAFNPKKNKNVEFRLPNYDPYTPCVSNQYPQPRTFAPADLLPTKNH